MLIVQESSGGVKFLRRGASYLEYMMVIVIVIMALVSMAVYIRGAIQGHYKGAGDSFGFGRQYAP